MFLSFNMTYHLIDQSTFMRIVYHIIYFFSFQAGQSMLKGETPHII